MNNQNYEGGTVFEELLERIFGMHNINISLQLYDDFPDLQNEGIDAIIKLPPELSGKTIQVKMFKKTFQYGTFPWEVSRYLTAQGTHVPEPHNANFHVIIDPVDVDANTTALKLLLFKTTPDLVNRYKTIWDEIVATGNLAPQNRDLNEAETKFWVEEGQYEPCFKWKENPDIYQLKLQHTAYQRNVRCRWKSQIANRLEMNFFCSKKFLSSVNTIQKLTVEELLSCQKEKPNSSLYDYLNNN